jgi:hypothetical protein
MTKSIDRSGEIWCSLDESLLQSIPLDEIVGQLIERNIEIIVHARVPLEHADQYLTVESGVLVECEASALADQNPVYDRASATSGIIAID